MAYYGDSCAVGRSSAQPNLVPIPLGNTGYNYFAITNYTYFPPVPISK